MPAVILRFVVAALVTLGVTGVALEARDAAGTPRDAAGTPRDAAGRDASLEAAAVRELLEGTTGHRVMWTEVPELVILTSVMAFSGPDMTAGYQATDELMTAEEAAQLEADLTAALGELTGGRLLTFAAVRKEVVPAGQVAPVFRRGQVVVGRFRDVRTTAGTVGFGGRTTHDGAITSAAVILDRDFDRTSSQRHLLRTHELGHALGFHHVESTRSVMNPQLGTELTEFDRHAIELGFLHTPPVSAAARPALVARIQN